MKWKVVRTPRYVDAIHSVYRMRVEKVQPKGSFSIELYKDESLVLQRIGKNFRITLSHLRQFKKLIQRGF